MLYIFDRISLLQNTNISSKYNCSCSVIPSVWAQSQSGSTLLCLGRGHREDMDRSLQASEPHVSLLTFASHTWCWACLPVCVCVCVFVSFHALFSQTLCEAAPSVSKFICHTSSGLVWSRGRLHTLFTCVTAETGLEVCVFMYVHRLTWSTYLSVCSSMILFLYVCVYTSTYMFALHTCAEEVCVHI